MGINGAGRRAQASQSGGFDPPFVGSRNARVQRLVLPRVSDDYVSSAFAPRARGSMNSCQSFKRVVGSWKYEFLTTSAENVQVVNFANRALDRRVRYRSKRSSAFFFREQAFDRVAKTT